MHVIQATSGASRPFSSRLQWQIRGFAACAGRAVGCPGRLGATGRLWQPPHRGRYSATVRASLVLCYGHCPPATGLTLPDPAHGWLRLERGRRLVLAVTPGAALAGGVLLPTAASADHGLILTRLVPAKPPGRGGIVAGQAALALARRIRLRRSAERSSSFKPPHVPYFSGLLTA